MSYQDDLDWLARNVHEWPTETDFVFVGVGVAHGRMGWYPADYGFYKASKVTIQQWLARRAELQDKPGWDQHAWPQIFQNEDGHWFGARDGWDFKAHIGKGFKGDGVSLLGKDGGYLSSGEILGDWRDTLEKRPDMHKNLEEIGEPAERVQKRPESIRNWREAGELPPVGVFVDVTGDVVYGEGEKGCEVIAHVENCAVIRMSCGLGCFVSRALSPHRTERDELVDIIASNGFLGRDGDACYLIADAIISAGFWRNGGKS